MQWQTKRLSLPIAVISVHKLRAHLEKVYCSYDDVPDDVKRRALYDWSLFPDPLNPDPPHTLHFLFGTCLHAVFLEGPDFRLGERATLCLHSLCMLQLGGVPGVPSLQIWRLT